MNREQWMQKRRLYSEIPPQARKTMACPNAPGALPIAAAADASRHAAALTWRNFQNPPSQGKS